jgi:hypothetical protein
LLLHEIRFHGCSNRIRTGDEMMEMRLSQPVLVEELPQKIEKCSRVGWREARL